MSNNKIGSIAMFICAFIWGISFVSIKVVVAVLEPMTLGFLRFSLASTLLFILVNIKKQNLTIDKEDYFLMFVAGAIGITAYFYFEFNGVRITTASTASLIIASIPVISALAESIVYKTKIISKKWMSLFLSIFGVLLIVGFNYRELIATGFLKGYLMMFAAAFTAVAYSLSTKPLFKRYDYLTIVFYQSLIGTIFFIPFMIFEDNNWLMLDLTIVLNIIFLGVFASAIGFYLYLIGLKHLGISNSAIFLNVIPIVSVIVSIIFLGERITHFQFIGGLFVISSVYLVNKPSGKKEITN
ncbi:MAG: DMT family transporter [Clostridiales bacterium]|nr:DMT family transporter [Clostridiales bacterium]